MSVSIDELHALWAEVFGEPPSVAADPDLLYDLLFRYLPPAPPYGEVDRARGLDQPPAQEGRRSRACQKSPTRARARA